MARSCSFFFFTDTATTEISTLSLHDALPIWTSVPTRWTNGVRMGGCASCISPVGDFGRTAPVGALDSAPAVGQERSEEHTSELQSLRHLVCRLLLEKKKKINKTKDSQAYKYK